MDKPKQERRNEARYILRGAHIAFKGHGATIDCIVRNLSNRGACLKVENSMLIPMLDKRLSVCYRLKHGHNLPNEPSQVSTRFP